MIAKCLTWMKQQRKTTIGVALAVLFFVLLPLLIIRIQNLKRANEKNEETKRNLVLIRQGISKQREHIKNFCNGNGWPSIGSLNSNSIIGGGDCSPIQMTAMGLSKFVSGTHLPGNPWGPEMSSEVSACLGEGCERNGKANCNGLPYSNRDDGWCYNPKTGEFWANSRNNLDEGAEFGF